MSQLMDFLIENPVENVTEQVVISMRLKNHPFTIRSMGSSEFFKYQKDATKYKKGKKVDFDSKGFNQTIVINHTVDPNFKDAEFVKKAGCATPEQLIEKVLLSGEVAELAQKITTLSGFEEDLDDLVEEAKNS